MRNKKNLLIALSSLIMLGMVTGCGTQGPRGDKGDQGIPGINGSDGKDGKDGETPYIGSNGNWWIGNSDTGIKAQGDTGLKGEKGDTPYIGSNGNWWISGIDSGISAQGPKGDKGDTGNAGAQGPQGEKGDKGDTGADGSTPTIGSNGNWWIDDVDTGVRAQGKDGTSPFIGENGNWWVGNVDTGVLAKANGIVSIKLTSTNGKQKTYTITFSDGTTFTFAVSDGLDGTDGKDGNTPTIGENGNWYINDVDTGVKATAVSIISIQKKSSNGNVDTYEVTLSNGDKYEFTVTNGTNGDTPYIGSNGNWWISNTDTGVKAQGPQGVNITIR